MGGGLGGEWRGGEWRGEGGGGERGGGEGRGVEGVIILLGFFLPIETQLSKDP